MLFVAAALAACSSSHGGDDAAVDLGAASDGGALTDLGHAVDASADAGPDASPPDGGTVPCAADDARAEICPGAICDGFDSWAWDGERCLRIDCGTCVGTSCGTLANDEATCLARHASCVPELCRATGGTWMFWAEECLHYRCGEPQPAACFVGMPVCDCGAGRSFVDGLGCALDPTCPEVDPLAPDALCAATGGTWAPGACCPSRCGVPCDLDCAAPACNCRATQIFDAARGCMDATECHVRDVGQECSSAPLLRCRDGLLCCMHCGGAGCDPTSTCEAPVCDANPDIDECGNNLLAP